MAGRALRRKVESILLDVPYDDRDEARRAQLLNILLASIAVILALSTIAAFVQLMVQPGHPRDELVHLLLVMLIAVPSGLVVYTFNRGGRVDQAGALLLVTMLVIITIADAPRQLVEGRSRYLFAIPILMASYLFRSWASFIVACSSSALLAFIGLSLDIAIDVSAIGGLFALAAVSWLSAHGMEKAIAEQGKSEEEFRTLVESSKDGIMMVQNGRIRFANTAVVRLTATPMDRLIGSDFQNIVAPAHRNAVRRRYRARMHGEEVPSIYEIDIQTRSGTLVPVEVNVGNIDFRGRPATLVFFRDITDRRQAESALRASEARYRALFESSPESITILDLDGDIVDVNDVTAQFAEIPRDSMIGRSFLDIGVVDPDHLDEYVDIFESLVRGERVEPITICTEIGGRKRWIEVHQGLVRQEGAVTGIQLISRDISERVRAQHELVASLEEKEVMLKEIHHRVKNNMQVISSMMSLQSSTIGDPEMLVVFKEVQDRVVSMGLIHNLLYQSEDLAGVDLLEYVRILGGHLASTYRGDARIELEVVGDNVLLGIDRAVPVGLLVNELISNAYKHAFAGRESGRVRIELVSHRQEFTLTVRDDGVGFPASVDFRDTPTLGMQLVVTLVEQISGSIEMDAGAGTTFRVRADVR